MSPDGSAPTPRGKQERTETKAQDVAQRHTPMFHHKRKTKPPRDLCLAH